MTALDEIWADDQLGRRSEAEALERFLVSETKQLIEANFDHAYVLGLDNPYGMGKTWFLNHLRAHLEEQAYPVAMVDAWADDSGDEPMIALMAAINEALKPHRRGKDISSKMAKAMKAVGTILIKGATGLAAKQVSKLIDDESAAAISKAFHGLKKDAAEEGGEEAAKALGDLANDYAKGAIDSYLTRKKSVVEFKDNLRGMAKALSREHTTPIFIVIDELDRCRPTYAIKLLEEVKHLFDVQGLVFVVALHGGQLAHSVRAIYGEKFEAEDYLQRFFSLTYRMSEPTFVAVTQRYFEQMKLPLQKMSVPSTVCDGHWGVQSPPIVLGQLFEAMNISLRSAIAVMNGIRVFCHQWEHDFPFDLITISYLVTRQIVQLDYDSNKWAIFKKRKFPQTLSLSGMEGTPEYRFAPEDLIERLMKVSDRKAILQNLVSGRGDDGVYHRVESSLAINSYIEILFKSEHRAMFSRGVLNSSPATRSVVADYQSLVANMARYFRDVEKPDNIS